MFVNVRECGGRRFKDIEDIMYEQLVRESLFGKCCRVEQLHDEPIDGCCGKIAVDGMKLVDAAKCGMFELLAILQLVADGISQSAVVFRCEHDML